MDGNGSISYEDIFKQLSASALIVNQRGMILFANQAYFELSGYESKDVIGKRMDLFVEGTCFKEENWQGEVYVKRKNKDDSLQLLYTEPVKDSNKNHLYTVLLIRDFNTHGMDPLTNLPNRFLLTQKLNKSITKAKENFTILAVLFIDIDRFKFINDTLGHAYGDLLLQEAAKRIHNSIGEGHFLVRLGGDEFVCILEDLKDESEAEIYAQTIIQSFSSPFQLKNTEIFITLSIGISIFPYDGDEEEILLTNADAAMYKAKKKGRNQYEKVKVNESAGAFEKLLLENSLRKALKEDELSLYFQPQINIKRNKMNSMEALVRWNHPELGMIEPSDFIPIAEETGLIFLIDDWVLRTACKKAKEWQKAGLPPIRVAVNLSAAHFLQSNLIEKIEKVLEETSLEPSLLELEITENIVMHDVHHAVNVLRKLKDRGIYISIDDFGTGYSSLSYLKELPVDTIKIDRTFIKDLDKMSNNVSLTKAMINLAHDLQLDVVAEGVENYKQLSLVKQQSCDKVQGYYFSKPINYEQTVQYYINNYLTLTPQNEKAGAN